MKQKKSIINFRWMQSILITVITIMIITNIFVPVQAATNIIINGVDIGYANESYFTKNGKSCKNSFWSNGRCHKNNVCTTTTHSQCNCMRYWPTGNPNNCEVDLLASQCFGFARYCQWKVYGEYDAQNSNHFNDITGHISKSNCTASNLKSKLMGCAPATHIRTANDAHSISIVSTDANGANVADANSDGYCKVRYKYYTWSQLSVYLQSYNGIAYANAWNGLVNNSANNGNVVGINVALDYPLEGVDLSSDIFTIMGWVQSSDVYKVTFSVNNKQEYPINTYWRDDIQGVGFQINWNTYEFFDFGNNVINVYAYLNNGQKINVGTRNVLRRADIAVDTPVDDLQQTSETLDIVGWVYSEYSDIEYVSVKINNKHELFMDMYTRDDVSFADAFRKTISANEYLQLGENSLQFIIHYTDGNQSLGAVKNIIYTVPCAVDAPSDNENISSDIFKILGWIQRTNIDKITFSINDGEEKKLNTYWREDVNGTGFQTELNTYEWLNFGNNSLKLYAYLDENVKIPIADRTLVRYAEFALDNPVDNSVIEYGTMEVVGWVYSEYSDIDYVSVKINDGDMIKLDMYTREDVEVANAFRKELKVAENLKYGDNTLQFIVHYTDGNQSIGNTISVTSKVVRVDFNPCGGSVSELYKEVINSKSYGELPVPIRSGYKFKGWYTEATGGKQITAETIVDVMDNQTLYAQWEKLNPYTDTEVKINGNKCIIDTKLYNIDNGSTVVVAGYKDAKLMEVETDVVENNTISFEMIGDFHVIKVFVLNNLRSLKPLCPAEFVFQHEFIS